MVQLLKSNRREELGRATAHAEVEAIGEACAALGTWRLEGCRLYVTLEPCPMCAGAVINARIAQIYLGSPLYTPFSSLEYVAGE